jgi:hypothetical protein
LPPPQTKRHKPNQQRQPAETVVRRVLPRVQQIARQPRAEGEDGKFHQWKWFGVDHAAASGLSIRRSDANNAQYSGTMMVFEI